MGAVAVTDFYNGFRARQLEDFEVRNRRVVAAIAFSKHALAGARSILDVGCGIGWTTQEMTATGARVTGLDLSPVLIATARRMFTCEFQVADFTEWQPEPFDAVLMVDVYEHFARADRLRVHERLAGTGARRMVLTTPTPAAQQYARDHGISLQPIDEDVTDEDVQRLADDVGGLVEVNTLVSVWRPDDYRHVLVRIP